MSSKQKKTRKQKMHRNKKSNRKSKKIYGSDSFAPYQIHKVTLISFNPLKTCHLMKKIFGSALGRIHSPPDKELKRRGIKWVRFLTGGKAELHFVPPFNIEYTKLLKKIVANQAIQAQQISKLLKQNNNVLSKIADKTSRIKYP